MINIEEVERIHNILIDQYGGGKGIRDLGGLEAAVNRPFATFDQVDLYSSSLEMAAAIFESLIINHPFIDGNKRIAFVMMRLLMLEDRLDIKATGDERYSFVISASTGEIRFDQIVLWLKAHTVPV